MAIKAMKMGEKARRNEKGYYLEKLWIGSREGKNPLSSTRWLHEKRARKTSGVNMGLYWTHQCSGHRWRMWIRDAT
jgi:hypothetical protein